MDTTETIEPIRLAAPQTPGQMQAFARTAGRGSAIAIQSARTSVRHPTSVATSRWPCSKSTPPTIGGNTWPNDSGQSGTASADPVLVTSPPTKSRTNVLAAVATASRWMPREGGIRGQCAAAATWDSRRRAWGRKSSETSGELYSYGPR